MYTKQKYNTEVIISTYFNVLYFNRTHFWKTN